MKTELKPKNYDRRNKSAHIGCAVVVSGVDANVPGLKSCFRERANHMLLWMTKTIAVSFAIFDEWSLSECYSECTILPISRLPGI